MLYRFADFENLIRRCVMSQPVGGVSRTKASDGTTGAEDPGTLSRDEDGQWNYTGDGSSSAAQVTQRMLDLETDKYSKGDSDFSSKAISGLSGAQKQQLSKDLAGGLLQENPSLTQDPNAKIPAGQKFSANVSDLKKALQPFVNNPNLATFLQNQIADSGGGPGQKKFGDVKSQGLSLPYEPG
jgi:hypothetical protein